MPVLHQNGTLFNFHSLVDEKAISLYFLTKNEIEKLQISNIQKIRFTIMPEQNGFAGTKTADNISYNTSEEVSILFENKEQSYNKLTKTENEAVSTKGYDYFIKKDYKSALLEFNNIVSSKKSTELYNIRLLRGITLFRLYRYEEAIQDLTNWYFHDGFYDINSQQPNVKASYYSLLGVCKTELKKYEEALQDFQKAYDDKDASPFISSEINTFKTGFENGEGWVMTTDKKAQCYTELGQENKAILVYEKCMKERGTDAIPLFHYRIGTLQDKLKKHEEAIKSLKKYLEASKSGDAYYALWSVTFNAKKYDDALNIINESIKKWSDISINYIAKGRTLYFLKRFDEASLAYDKALSYNNEYTNLEAYIGKGYTLLELGQNEQAVICFSKAISIDPNNGAALEGKKEALIDLEWKNQRKEFIQFRDAKMYGKAAQKCVEMIEKGYDIEWCYSSAGWYFLLDKQFTQAVKWLRKGLEKDEYNLNMKGNLAHAYLLTNEFEKAKEIYLKHANEKYKEDMTWKEMVKQDFLEFESLGIRSEYFDKIRQLLGI